MLSSGDVVGGRYRLVEPLGSGGMGTVWRAHHTELGIDIALKVMLPAQGDSEQGKSRFRREARAAAKLKSPHVVQVHDFGVFDEHPYLAMELLEGESLEARLDRDETLPLDECAHVVDGVARALQLAHDRGVIHRDLKPANIFLASVAGEEVAKVLDFGIAKLLDAKGGGEGSDAFVTGAGLVGSPAYMSPEQVWGEPLGTASDLWSLGVVVFEMLTGENPFGGGTLAKVFERIVRDDLPRLRDRRDDLPAALDAFFERALARDAAERFACARDFAQAFRRAIAPAADEPLALQNTVALDERPAAAPAPRQRRLGAFVAATFGVAAIALLALGRSPGTAAASAVAAAAGVRGTRFELAKARNEPTTVVAPAQGASAEPAVAAPAPRRRGGRPSPPEPDDLFGIPRGAKPLAGGD
jgi:serine/threonine-protein kinase